MKQVSHPPFLGIVDDKKWCPFFNSGVRRPNFCTWKRPFSVIFGQFSLIKSQNHYPMLHSVNFWDKNLIFGIWLPYIQRQLDLGGRVTKMIFDFWGTPYCTRQSVGSMSVIAAEAKRMKEPASEVRSHHLRHVSNPTYRALCGPIRAAWWDLQF